MDGRGSIINIGVLSDTHGWLDPGLKMFMEGCHEIWHAGDVGAPGILDELRSWGGRLRAVHGNIDGTDIWSMTNEIELFELQGYKVLMTHIAKPSAFGPELREQIQKHHPQMLVAGHSHILKVQRLPALDMMYVNPGAAGTHGFHKVRTALRFALKDGKPEQMKVIELAPRRVDHG